MMLFISVLQGDALLLSSLQAATLGVTVVLLLLLRHVRAARSGVTPVSPETLAWIHDLEVRPAAPEPSGSCLESLAWIKRLQVSGTPFRSRTAAPITMTKGTAHIEQADDAQDLGHSSDVRVLRLQVKSLETALDEQTERLRELGAQLQLPAEPAQDLDAVLATIHGLRTSMALDPAALRVLDRVEGAVCRLGGVPEGLARPALPGLVSSTAITTSHLDQADVEHTEPVREVLEVELPPVEQYPTLELPVDPDLAVDQPTLDVTPVEEPAPEVASGPVSRVPDHLVQPVPAPEPAQPATSRRRWARGLAA